MLTAGRREKRNLELSRSRLTSRRDQSNCRPENTGAVKTETGIAPENRNGVTIMARTSTPAPAPHAARSAADTATTPAPAAVAPAAGDSPAAAVLAALSADPAGATVAVIAARAGDQHGRRPAGSARAGEGRDRYPGQGQPARYR